MPSTASARSRSSRLRICCTSGGLWRSSGSQPRPSRDRSPRASRHSRALPRRAPPRAGASPTCRALSEAALKSIATKTFSDLRPGRPCLQRLCIPHNQRRNGQNSTVRSATLPRSQSPGRWPTEETTIRRASDLAARSVSAFSGRPGKHVLLDFDTLGAEIRRHVVKTILRGRRECLANVPRQICLLKASSMTWATSSEAFQRRASAAAANPACSRGFRRNLFRR